MQQMTFDNLMAQQQPSSAYDRLMEAKAKGRRAMAAVAKASGPDFQHRAYEFAVKFFREHGKASAPDHRGQRVAHRQRCGEVCRKNGVL